MVWEPAPRAIRGGSEAPWPVPMAPVCSHNSPSVPLEDQKDRRNFITVRDWKRNPFLMQALRECPVKLLSPRG